jgi:uncharacterized Zn-finger protein
MNHRNAKFEATLITREIIESENARTNDIDNSSSPQLFQKFKCIICGKKFSKKGTLRTHEHTHLPERLFSCDVEICGKWFTTLGNLKCHLSIHNGIKDFKCSFIGCDKTYYSLCRLKTHERLHTGSKPFSCEFCHKTFNEKGNLSTHIRTHTGERPFYCNFKECNAKFKAKSHLNNHMRIHLNLKPYECSICSAKFSRKSSLKIHHYIHSGEKPFICDIEACRRTFSDKGYLKNHLKTHSPLQIQEIKMHNEINKFSIEYSKLEYIANNEDDLQREHDLMFGNSTQAREKESLGLVEEYLNKLKGFTE